MHKYAQICTGQTKYVSFAFISIYMQKYAHIYKISLHEMHIQTMQKICTPHFSDGGPSNNRKKVLKFWRQLHCRRRFIAQATMLNTDFLSMWTFLLLV